MSVVFPCHSNNHIASTCPSMMQSSIIACGFSLLVSDLTCWYLTESYKYGAVNHGD